MAISFTNGREIVRCNKCGKILDEWDIHSDYSIHRHIGYGSRYDGEKVHLRLCCECMDYLIEQCAFSPLEDDQE